MARVKAKDFDIDTKRWGIRQPCHHDLDHKLELDTDTSHSSYTTASGRDLNASNSSSKMLPAPDDSVATRDAVVDMFEILENASFDLNSQLQATPRRDSLVTMTEEKRSQILSRSATDLNYFFESDLADAQVPKKNPKASNDSFDFSDVWWNDADETQSLADLPVTMKVNRKSSRYDKKTSNPSISPQKKAAEGSVRPSGTPEVFPTAAISPTALPDTISQPPEASPPLVATSPSPKPSLSSPVPFSRGFKKARSYGQILDDSVSPKESQSPPSEKRVIPAPPLHREAPANEAHGLSPATTTTPPSVKRKKKCIKVRAKDLGILQPNATEVSAKPVDVHKVQDAFRKLFGTGGAPENGILKPSKLRLPSRGRTREEPPKEGEKDRGRSASVHRSRSRTTRKSRTAGEDPDTAKLPATDEKKRSASSRLRSLSRPRRRSLAPTDRHSGEPAEVVAGTGHDGSRPSRASVEIIDSAVNKPVRPRSASLKPKRVKEVSEEPRARRASSALLSASAHEPSRRETKSGSSPLGNGPNVTENRLLRRRSSSLSPKKVKESIRLDKRDLEESNPGPSLKDGTPSRLRSGPSKRPNDSTTGASNEGPTIVHAEGPRTGRGIARTGSSVAREIGITSEQLERLFEAGFQIIARPSMAE